MSRVTRSARGELIDFELLAIKAQLASAPVPRSVEDRKVAIDLKDGVRTTVAPEIDMSLLAVAVEAATTSAKGGQLLKK